MTPTTPNPDAARRFSASMQEMRDELCASRPRDPVAMALGLLLLAVIRFLDHMAETLAQLAQDRAAGLLPAASPAAIHDSLIAPAPRPLSNTPPQSVRDRRVNTAPVTDAAVADAAFAALQHDPSLVSSGKLAVVRRQTFAALSDATSRRDAEAAADLTRLCLPLVGLRPPPKQNALKSILETCAHFVSLSKRS